MANENKIGKLKQVMSKNYEVGYCKPPESTRFQKGQSGNPKGRKKKTIPKSINEALTLELTNKHIITKEHGKQENVYLFQVLAKQLIQDALKSDKHSRKLLMELLNQKDLLLSRKQLEEREPEVDSEHERELRNRFLNDLNEMYRELDKEEAKKS